MDFARIAAEIGETAGVWIIFMVIKAYGVTPDRFSFVDWFSHNVNKFIVGGVLTVGIVFLNATVPNFSMLLNAIGFTTEATTISFGLAIGGFLLLGSNQGKTPPSDDGI